jgi:hypothetical protein
MTAFPTDATYSYDSTVYSMVNRRPDRNYSYVQSFDNAIFTSQGGYERRRQISRRRKRTFNFAFNGIRGVYKAAIENFYNSRGGTYESFEFDLSYAGQSGTMISRFSGDLNIIQVLTTDNPLTDIYNITFSIQEVFS